MGGRKMFYESYYDSNDTIPYQPTAEDEEAYADWLEYLAREVQNADARA